MTILKVIKDPNLLLRMKSLPISQIDDPIRAFMQSLLETMYDESGIGIAAIQVGNPIRALIIDIPIDQQDENGQLIQVRSPFFIINPSNIQVSKEQVVLNEGCLSVVEEDKTGFQGKVERPISIAIDYLDLDGTPKHLAIDGTKSDYDLWFARCLQHELDHLEGILFIDKLYIEAEILDELSDEQ